MKERKLEIVAFLIFCNLIALSIFLGIRKEQDLEVVFFDVGQGDSALIRTEEGKNILIDGGPGQKLLPHLNDELPFWDRDIDLIILTHAHADHLSGLVEVLERFNVKKVLWNKQEHDSVLYRQWEQSIENVKSKQAYKGQRIDLGEAYLDVLYPPKDYDSELGLNENSVINRLVHEEGAILFTGDAYEAQEIQLMEWEESCFDEDFNWCKVMILPSEILKAGHHGSSTSSNYEFIERVDPEIAVISAGKDNRYGHPHEETLETFNSLGVSMHKTFKEGNFRVFFD